MKIISNFPSEKIMNIFDDGWNELIEYYSIGTLDNLYDNLYVKYHNAICSPFYLARQTLKKVFAGQNQ